MKNKVAKRGRPSKFDDFWKKVVEWRLEGLFIPAIAKKLGITKPPIYAWLEKGKHDDQEKKYQLFLEEYKKADTIATMKDLDEFDVEISQMSKDTPEFNKYNIPRAELKREGTGCMAAVVSMSTWLWNRNLPAGENQDEKISLTRPLNNRFLFQTK